MSDDPGNDFFGIYPSQAPSRLVPDWTKGEGALTREILEEAFELVTRYKPPCGSVEHPHLCAPVGVGVPTICVCCGAPVTYTKDDIEIRNVR